MTYVESMMFGSHVRGESYKKDFKQPSKSTTYTSFSRSITAAGTKCVAVNLAIPSASFSARAWLSSPPENILGPASIPPLLRYLSKTFFLNESMFRFLANRWIAVSIRLAFVSVATRDFNRLDALGKGNRPRQGQLCRG